MSTGYLIQGLRQNTLVAGKTTGLRLVVGAGSAPNAATVEATIVGPDGSVRTRRWVRGAIGVASAGSANESVVVAIAGRDLPSVGLYYIRARIVTESGGVAADVVIDAVPLLATRDLRMLVSRIWSGTATAKPGEVQAAVDAMARLAALYPVRDGISGLNGDPSAGLRYDIQDNPVGPPNQDGNITPLWDTYHPPAAGKDTLDCALMYRFPDAGEGSGARTHATYNGWLPNSGIVWQAPLAHVFSHETGHNHGLEPASDPHFDPAGQASHSKDRTIDPTDADQGYDLQFMKPFPVPLLDVMFPSGDSPGEPADQICLNAWDREFIRERMLTRDSTGPGAPALGWQSLGGHDLRPAPAAMRNQDGRLEVFVLGGDRALYHAWELLPGGAWHAWASLGGHDLAGPVELVARQDGSLQVFVAGADGQLYTCAQTAPNGGWGPWSGLGGSKLRGYSVARNADGRLEVVAVFGDGTLYDTWQTAPQGPWAGWTPLGGHDLAGPTALAANADGRLEAFAIGGDGHLYHRWQLRPNGQGGWGAWSILLDALVTKVVDLRVAAGADGRLFVFTMSDARALGYLAQVAPNGGWGAAIDLGGHDLRWPCAVARGDDGRLEATVVGGDRHLYSRWQVDPARPQVWADWTKLGGHDLQAGIALSGDRAGQLEVLAIGGDGALYRGTRVV